MSYLFRAAYLASQQKEVDRAISILDKMSSQDLASSGNQKAWDAARTSLATSGALAYLKRSDVSSMRRLIADTLARLRPFVQVQVAEKMAADGYRADAIELMRDAREGLSKADPSDSTYHYLKLSYLCAKVLPSDALPTLIDKSGTIIRLWPGSSQDKAVRERMANQIVADALREVSLRQPTDDDPELRRTLFPTSSIFR